MNATPILRAAAFFVALTATAAVMAQDQGPAPATQPDIAATAPAPKDPASETRDISYAVGYDVASKLTQLGVELDADQLALGIKAGLNQIPSRLTDEQLSQAMFNFQMQIQQRQLLAMKKDAQANLASGQTYLQENARRDDVTVTDSGLQYKVIQSGDGPTPTVDNTVVAHYRGTMIDGTEFDSSLGGEPARFKVGKVIPGWMEALQLMKVGDKWELTIPSDLAYGEAGIPQAGIGPNAVLLFEVELLGIE